MVVHLPSHWSGIIYKMGAVCRNFKKYEEVHVPAMRTGSLNPNEHLVQISEMEDWAQLAFDGYKCGHALGPRIMVKGLKVSFYFGH